MNSIIQKSFILDLGEISDLNINSRSPGCIYAFTFTQSVQHSPYQYAGGYGFLFVNNETMNYGRQILFSNVGISTRALSGGTYGSWQAIVSN